MARDKGDYIIEILDLVTVFNKEIRAVDGLNIEIRRGEVFGFLTKRWEKNHFY
jgi:ABC-type multidrug transport system ATPase subunit